MADSEKIKELTQKISDGVQKTFQEENFKAFLKTMSVFHGYSLRNTILIYSQCESATRVAGFETWKKLGRFVKRGEKGIAIFAPCKVTLKKDKQVYDENGNPKKSQDGKPITEEDSDTIIKFKITYVYDVTQTDGEPLPEICNELQGSVENYEKIFNALKSIAPYPVVFKQMDGDTKGYCNFDEEIIAIKLGMSDEQILKTLIHELAHATMHKGTDKERGQKEVEAESMAYIVSDFLGFDTSGYSFEYVASWSQGMELNELQTVLENIQNSANQIINRLQEEMKSIEQEQSKEQTVQGKESLQNRLQAAAEKSNEIHEKELSKNEQYQLK